MVNCADIFDCLIFRKSKKEPSDKEEKASERLSSSAEAVPPAADSVVKPWIDRALGTGVPALIEEFRSLAKWTPEDMTLEAFNANKEQNRYQDVPCQDKGRIILKFPGLTTDYIHANFLGTPSTPHRFICAQGPLENTQLAYWAMIIQENVECIVMLCNCIEQAKLKCHQYWPEAENGKLSFGEEPNQVHVTNMGSERMSPEEQSINITTLKIDWAEGTRTVLHYQWENWPDRGVPITNLTAINLLSAIRRIKTPILVHCSAGIGRTGTIVALAYVLDKLTSGKSCVAMSDVLKEIRSQRPWLIQNQVQYLYLHRVLLAYFLDHSDDKYGNLLTVELEEKYKKWITDYELATTPIGT